LQSLATVTDPAFNKLSAIFHLLSLSKIKWRPVHVKGHQDDSQPTEELSRLAQLNDEMHLMAKLHLKHATFCRLYTILHEAWSIWHQGKKISHKYHDNLYTIMHSDAARAYLSKKGNFNELALDLSDW
jgi:hypothetical protein